MRNTMHDRPVHDEPETLHTVPTVGEALPAMRRIVDTKSHHPIPGGLQMDLFTASAIVVVYDALSPKARISFSAMGLLRGQAVAFKMIEELGKKGSPQ